MCDGESALTISFSLLMGGFKWSHTYYIRWGKKVSAKTLYDILLFNKSFWFQDINLNLALKFIGCGNNSILLGLKLITPFSKRVHLEIWILWEYGIAFVFKICV